MKEGLSRIRNRGIAEAFAYMHMIEGWGSGIPDMFTDAKRYGLPEPSLEDRGSDFRVNLYRRPLDIDLYGVIDPQKNGTNGANGAIFSGKALDDQNGALNGALENNDGALEGNLESRIISLIKDQPHMKQKELINTLNISRKTLQRIMKNLTEKGLIERKGGKRYGYWVIYD